MRHVAGLLCLSLLAMAAGCGNVSVQGDAMAALEASTMDAYDFASRVQSDPGASPLVKAYATDNFVRWRWFACSAKNDSNWGPTLPVDANALVQTKASAAFVRLEDLEHE